jgi:hypothetical protein
MLKSERSQAQWCTPITSALRRLRQEGYEFQGSQTISQKTKTKQTKNLRGSAT